MPPTPVITSRTNARVKQLRAAFQGHARLASGLVAIEGEHLVAEALESRQAIKTLFLSERHAALEGLPAGIEVLTLATDVFQSAVETQSPQGIAALLVPLVWRLNDLIQPAPLPLLLVAVGLQDPGNLGTLIRSAEAFNATAVLTTPGTVSPWNQKVIRASAGSVFRMPLAELTVADAPLLEAAGIQMLAAVREHSLAAESAELARATALLIGNEGAGLDPVWLALAAQRVTIPCPGPVESLNAAVAGSLLLYEASRQRRGR